MKSAYGKNYQKSKCPYANYKLRNNVYYVTCHCKSNPRNIGLGAKINSGGNDLRYNGTRCLGRNIQGIGTFRDCEYYQMEKHGKVRREDKAKTFNMSMSEYINPRGQVNTFFAMLFGSILAILNPRNWLIVPAFFTGIISYMCLSFENTFLFRVVGVLFGVLTVFIVLKFFGRKKR